jgi:hypothetical protein
MAHKVGSPYGYIGRYFCLHIIVRIMINRRFMVSSIKLTYSVMSQYTSIVEIGTASMVLLVFLYTIIHNIHVWYINGTKKKT